jgi:hypothetical protein
MKGKKLTFHRCDSTSNFQQQNNNGTCHFKLGVDMLFDGRVLVVVQWWKTLTIMLGVKD